VESNVAKATETHTTALLTFSISFRDKRGISLLYSKTNASGSLLQNCTKARGSLD
jgi:hypothetical protein